MTDIGRPRPAPASSIPAVLARIGNLELVARHVVDGFINGMHRSPYFGASVDFAEHRGYVRRRRHPPRRLAAVRAHRSVLHQGVRGGHERQLLGAARRLEVDGVRQPRHHKLEYGKMLAGCLDLPRAPAARSRRLHRVRHRHRRARAAVGEAHGRRAAHARPAEAGAARATCGRRCRRWPSISAAAACWCSCRTCTRSRTRCSRRSGRCVSAATTSSCFTCWIRPRSTSLSTTPSSFEDLETRRADSGRARRAGRAVPCAGAGAHRRR